MRSDETKEFEVREGLPILEIARDPLFKLVFPGDTDYFPISTNLRPLPARIPYALQSASLIRIVWRLVRRRYAFVALPAIHRQWHADASFGKALLRHGFSMLSRSSLLCRCIGRVLGLERTKVVALDISDDLEISKETLRLFQGLRGYYKYNLIEGLSVDDFGVPLRYLPMSLLQELYLPYADSEKKTDVFFAAQAISGPRNAALTQLRLLQAKGYSIDIVEERIPFESYLERMSAAWLTLSPEGYGHQCWRHAEALLVSSVPVINWPEPPTVQSLVDQREAIFYEWRGDDLTTKIEEALRDKEKLRRMAKQGHDTALRSHTATAVAHWILSTVG